MILALVLSASLAVPSPPTINYGFDIGKLAEPRVTKAVLITSAAVLLVSELLILNERSNGHVVPTISHVMQDWGAKYNTIPFFASALVSHWWLNQQEVYSEHARGNIFAAIAVAMLLWDVKVAIFGASPLEAHLRNPPYLAVGIGAAAGAVFWTQKVRF